MIRRARVALLVLVAGTMPAAAEPSAAYVDPLVVAGGPDLVQARRFADALIRRAGLKPQFAGDAMPACGDDVACLATRARVLGAVLGVRLTIVEIGDEIIVSLLVAAPQGTMTRHRVASEVDLERGYDALVAILRIEPPARPSNAVFRVGVLTGIVGLGSAATGIYFAARARSGWEDITQLSNAQGTWSDRYATVEADAARAERRSTVLIVAGAAAIVTGFVLGYVGWRSARPHVVVTPEQSGAQASVTWWF